MKLTFCPEGEKCKGAKCPRARRWDGHRTMGLTDLVEPGVSCDVWKSLAQMLFLSAPSLADGTQFLTPQDAEFEIHHMGPYPGDEFGRAGWDAYTAMYSGDAEPMQLVTASIPYTAETFEERRRYIWEHPIDEWCSC